MSYSSLDVEWRPALVSRGIALFLMTYVGWIALAYFRSPLRCFPGPFLAGCTDLWRYFHTLKGDIHLVNRRLHKKYGPVVRSGPNNLELDLPSLIKTIYSSDGRWRKTEFYPPASNVVDGKIASNLFSLVDPAEHARQKRPVAKHYSMAGVLPLEHHIDDTIRILCHQLEARFTRDGGTSFGKAFDIGRWVRMYAWDVIGEVTFSKRFGYLHAGGDFDGHLYISEIGSDYLASVSQIPWLDRWIDKNPIYPIGGATVLLGPTLQYVKDRYAGKDGATHDPHKPDFLDKFIEAKAEYPNIVNDPMIIGYLAINMLAGADTTAITIKAVLYYALRTPGVWEKLEQAVLETEFVQQNNIPPPYAEAKAVPFVEAVVREAMRLHPGVAMTLPRYVPEGEPLVLPGGSTVPPGTSVGMNPYVIGRNRAVWGEDADEFRPERWLRDEASGEGEHAFAERLGEMNNADLTFGAGSRTCLGRNLASIEIYKVVVSLVALYEIELVNPEKEWWVRNGFFLRQAGPEVKLRMRQKP